MHPTSTIEISKSAIKNNFNFFREIFGANVKISSVVKGNAYGHGIEAYVPIAKEFGVQHFSVFSAEEALRVKNTAPDCEIMIMGMMDDEDVEWAIKNNIEFFVFDIERLQTALTAAKKLKKPAKIHIEIETGLNRTGFNKKGMKEVIKILKENIECFAFEGLCTHFAGAESINNYNRIKKQIRRYNSAYLRLLKQDLIPKYRHTACSAATISYPETRMDMVRIGVMQYGFWSTPETYINYLSKNKEKTNPLKRALTWKTKIMSTKTVMRGEFIGYGTTFLAQEDMKIGIIPVGYSHGYSRSLSNTGRVLIQGQRSGVVGNVNMNVTTIDITHIPEAKRGEEVILIGEQGNMKISIASFSEYSDLLNYEVLTHLSETIPRIVVE